MIILIILIIVLLLSFNLFKNLFKSNGTILDEIKLREEELKKKGLALMVQQDDGTYQESTSNSWPTDMVFNNELSGCIDTSGKKIENALNYNSDTNSIILKTNVTSYCYVYFDVKKSSVTLTVSTDGTKGTLPTYNHYKQTLSCDEGTTSTFNTKYQRIEISNVGKTNIACNLNYTNDTSTYTLLRTKVESVGTAITSTNNAGRTDTSYRYTGKTPSNYVWFNNELWRIIGSIPVCTTSGCRTPTTRLVKIIRAESIGGLSYHSSASSPSWGTNTLYTLLNTKYYGKLDATGSNLCLGYSAYTYALCNYTNIGISNDSTDYYGRMVKNVYWNSGVSTYDDTVNSSYKKETGLQTASGKIGLMTASDYGYASGIAYSSVDLLSISRYANNNWLYGQGDEWTMTPYSASNQMHVSVYGSIFDGGTELHSGANNGYAVRPVLYLDSNVYIISGNGTESNPYVLGM